MNRSLMTLAAVAAFGTFVPAAPAVAMELSSVDCASAPAMMMKPESMAMAKPGAMMTTDAAFDHMSTDMMHHAAMMAGMELKCGKSPSSRAHAAALLKQLNEDGVAEAKEILNTYNH